MTSPLVKPVSGYSTLSRLVSFSWRPSMVAVVFSGTRRVYPPEGALRALPLARGRLLRGSLDGPCRLGFLGLAVSRLVVGGPSCRVALARLLRRRHARLEGGHEVDDLVSSGRLRGRHQFCLAGSLALDQLEHPVAVGVLVLVRLERSGQ